MSHEDDPALAPLDPALPSLLGKKKRIRGGYRAHCTKIINEAKEILKSDVVTILKIEHLAVSLKDKLNILQRIDDEILNLMDANDVEEEVLTCEDLRSEVQEIVIELESKRDELKLKSNKQEVSSNSEGPSSRVGTSSSENAAKLPKLQLPKYQGDPRKWQEFWDAFEVVHKSSSLAPVDKFRHLKSLLEGPAALAISGIQLTGANYKEAIDILTQRFAQKQVIVNAHMEALLNLPRVSSERDIRELRKLFDSLEINIRSLKSLGIDFKQYGTLLVPIIMSKLPDEIRLTITKGANGDTWELEVLLKTLRAELEAREQCGIMKFNNGANRTKGISNNAAYTTSALFSSERKVTCTFCKGPHQSAKCQIVSSPQARKDILRKQGRCFVCLKRGHLSRACASNIRCFLCKQRHHMSICESRGQTLHVEKANPLQLHQSSTPQNANFQSVGSNPLQIEAQIGKLPERLRASGNTYTSQNSNSMPQPHGPSTATMLVNSKNAILLQTAKGYISPPASSQPAAVARIIFDSGSQRSYISAKLRDSLALPTIGRETLTIKTFGNNEGEVLSCDITQFCVGSPYSDMSTYVKAYVVPVVCAPLRNQEIDFALNTYPHLATLHMADFQTTSSILDVDILIGLDFYWSFLTGGSIRGEIGGPIALESRLGWILSGEIQNCKETTSTSTNFAQTHVLRVEEHRLEEQVSRFWDLESIGIDQQRENSVYQQFQEEIEFKDGRYEVKLPWKQEHPLLPDNYSLCQKRLQGLARKLHTNEDFMKEYDAIIKGQEELGIIEKVAENQESPVGRTHYLPHHPVIRQDKTTTKVRIVYDASASTPGGVSLNNCLYEGPCLLRTVAEILTRFRLHKIALTSDIEKAFLMISINEADRDVLRFLWFSSISGQERKIQVYRFCRVVFGVSCSPFLLNATLKRHIQGYATEEPEICNNLLNSLYADDINSGSHKINEVIDLYKKSKLIMQKGGFNLRKWRSNSPEVMKEIKKDEDLSSANEMNKKTHIEEDESFAKSTTRQLSNTEQADSKVLGVPWNSETDMLSFKLSHLSEITEDKPITKRTILKTIASIFDPLGLISPIVTPMKVFLQQLFELKLGWDNEVSDQLQRDWKLMMSALKDVGEISLPRYYFGTLICQPKKIQLIGFCDSSEKAYAAVVYARVAIEDKASVALVMSKSRVAPLSRLTIPRLELLSCLILARLIVSVKEMLSPMIAVEAIRCYTDSITSLYWIKGTSREWKLFVENRVQEIRRLVEPGYWSHCKGEENPADIPTRRSNVSKLERNSMWWNGPSWVMSTQLVPLASENSAELADMPMECTKELKVKGNAETSVLCMKMETVRNLSKVITIERYSSYKKLVQITGYVLRFLHNCRKRSSRRIDELSVDETHRAEKILIQSSQCTFDKDYLEKITPQLGIYKDKDGILRCGGRLNNSNLDIQAKNPILLPRNSHLSNLIIRESHSNVMHNGVKETLAELRSRFWIVKGRQLVKKIIGQCKICTRIQGLSYGEPDMSQLPDFRVQEVHAFHAVGIDFAGPLFIKSEDKSLKKVYIALFTCATTRALHLEIVPDLNTATFLLCFKRFVSRRGLPSIIVTDNAKTFKAASKTIVKLFKSKDIVSYLAHRKIQWKFNVAKAPWWGGFYERLIRGIKSCLKKNVSRSKLSYDELQTVIAEIESVLNSRPLTYLYSELEEPLTPTHLIVGRRLLSLPEYRDDEDIDYNETASVARKREQHLSRVLGHYWRRWKKEYLIDLREHHKAQSKTSNRPRINIGDIVTIENENIRNRVAWRLGRITDIIIGKDGVTRGAIVQLSNGNLIERPIQKLFPLELSSGAEGASSPAQNEELPDRPKRKAAIVARESIRILDQLDEEDDDPNDH